MTVYDVAAALPDIPVLRDRCRAMAMVNAILEQGEFRMYRYDTGWAPGVDLASMDDGSGDSYSVVFSQAGVFICGFDHESPMNRYDEGDVWPGLVEGVPEALADWVIEPEFSIDGDGVLTATACLWRETGADRWRTGQVSFPADGDDGADYLFNLLADGTPEAYCAWATDYYERPVDLAAVRRVYALEPLTESLVALLDPDRELADVAGDAAAIGYPTHPTPAG